MKNENVGIIGYGVVGKTIDIAFGMYSNIYKYDPKLDSNKSTPIEEICYKCKHIFVCVPTPYSNKSQSIDLSILYETLDKLAETSTKAVIIIKSTVTPFDTKTIITTYSNLRILFNPEILTQRQAAHDFVNQPLLILGGNKTDMLDVEYLYDKNSICNKQAKLGFCTPEEASLAKYMFNSMMATKNIFLNEFKELHNKLTEGKSSFDNFMKIFFLDERMGVMPFDYSIPGPDGDYGYGGKCLPKDTKSIISEAENNGVFLNLLKVVDEVNEKIRKNKDWETIEGAVTDE